MISDDLILREYLTWLRRQPHPAEFEHWRERVTTEDELIAGIVGSPEALALEERKAAIRAVFAEALQRDPWPSEIDHWIDREQNGEAVRNGVLNSPEANRLRAEAAQRAASRARRRAGGALALVSFCTAAAYASIGFVCSQAVETSNAYLQIVIGLFAPALLLGAASFAAVIALVLVLLIGGVLYMAVADAGART